MKRLLAWSLGLAAAGVLATGPARAQPAPQPSPQTATSGAAGSSGETKAPGEPGAGRRFVHDVGHDYLAYFSWETAAWLAGGGVSALSIHTVDDDLRQATEDPEAAVTRALEGGATYGNVTLQIPLAVGWWAIAHAAGSQRHADAGRDLLRAQISAMSWTYAFKVAADRTRPNGDPRSFPSGHASATFATAMVLQDHYGWKLGLPAFGAAFYTAASRITVNKHWASDVVFGAALGMASARTVTLHLRGRTLALSPLAVPGGAGIGVRVAAN